MKFTKMHGCGNDYIYVNGFEEKVAKEWKPELARRLSHRKHGIGGDGLIFINPSEKADFAMEMFNADGTRAQMCGNGIRCVGKYVYDKGMTDALYLTVESGGEVKYLELMLGQEEEDPDVGRASLEMCHDAGKELEEVTDRELSCTGKRDTVKSVRVNMGTPVLSPLLIPVLAEGDSAVNVPIVAGGREYRMTCVSMGNPHAVIFVNEPDRIPLEETGPLFEHHTRFPERVNTEFVEVVDRGHCFLRVWERGTGETLACGTGACAAVVAGVLNDLTKEQVRVTMPGGELFVEWDRNTNLVYMTGPAVTVFDGEINI